MSTTQADVLTDVVFRVWKDTGNVIALFPYEPYSNFECMSYEHVGQHGSADYTFVVDETKPAQPEDYADLKAELERIGYKLRPIKKVSATRRKQAIKEMWARWT